MRSVASATECKLSINFLGLIERASHTVSYLCENIPILSSCDRPLASNTSGSILKISCVSVLGSDDAGRTSTSRNIEWVQVSY